MTNHANTWSAVPTDHLPNPGVSDLAVNPKKPSVMYIATGDPDCIMDPNGPALSCESCLSRGIVKSTDGGQTWTEEAIGNWYDNNGVLKNDFWKFPSNKIIHKLLINPKKPDLLYALFYNFSYETKTYPSYVLVSYEKL